MSLFYFLLIIAVAAYGLLAWQNLRLALGVLIALLPTYLIRFSILSIPFTLLEAFLILALLSWILHTVHRDETKRRQAGGVLESPLPLTPMALILLAATIGIFVADDALGALGVWKAYFVEPVLIFVILRSVFKKREDSEFGFQALCVSGILLSLFASIQYFTGAGIPTPWDIELRVTSVFDYPNALGLYLGPIVAAAAVLFVRDGGRKRDFKITTPDPSLKRRGGSALYLATILLGGTAIVLAETEAAYFAIPGALVLTLLFSSAKKQLKIGVLTASIVLLAILIAVVPIAREKLFLQDYSGEVRLSLWSETMEMLQSRQLLGAGLNGFPEALEPFHDPTYFELFQYPHNIVLNIWSELGLLGILAVLWLGVILFKTLRTRNEDPLVLAASAALLVMVIHGLVDVPYFKNDLATMTWIFIGMMYVPKKK